MSESRNPPASRADPPRMRRQAAQSGPAVRGQHGVRWRDIEWVEFEPMPASPPVAPSRLGAPLRGFPVAANSNEFLPEPAPPAAPEPLVLDIPEIAEPVEIPAAAPEIAAPAPELQPPEAVKAPRYGRAIAPLPPHLTAAAPLPARPPAPPASLRPPGTGLGKAAALGGAVMSTQAAGRGRMRPATIAAALGLGAILVYGGGAWLSARVGWPVRPAAVPAVAAIAVPPAAAAKPDPAAPKIAAPPAPAPPAAPVVPQAAAPAPAPDRAAALLAAAKSGDATAQFNLGALYASGDGVAQDYAKAAAWFREAAINGSVAAQFDLAVLYERGLGIGRNINEALIWYHSAAAHNYPPAQYNLALTYADGRGTPKDLVAAGRWYRRAAEGGVVPAMVNLAILLESGTAMARAPAEAYAWYRAAGERGDEAGGKRAGELLDSLSAADKTRAEAAFAAVAATIRPPAAAKPGA